MFETKNLVLLLCLLALVHYSKEASGNYPEWSSNNKAYAKGDLVQYQGKVYECIGGHSSNVAWTPTDAYNLWKYRSDLVPGDGKKDEGKKDDGKKDDGKKNEGTTTSSLPKRIITGFWHNFLNGSKALRIKDVPNYYNLIAVAFADSTGTPGEVTFRLNPDLAAACGGYTEQEFIQEVKAAKKNGQHVIISIGGATGTTYITDQNSANNFASSLITIIDKFGFEGVDIDFEGAAVSGTNYIAGALRKVHDHFGSNFIITMAPETYYMQANRMPSNEIVTAYWRLAIEIKDILTVVYPQFYNSGTMYGYGGIVASYPSADFLVSLGTLYIENGLRPDQVAFGVPSTSNAAGSGYLDPSFVSAAVKSIIGGTPSGTFKPPKAYPNFRGVMTWSINWDATNNYNWGRTMKNLMDTL